MADNLEEGKSHCGDTLQQHIINFFGMLNFTIINDIVSYVAVYACARACVQRACVYVCVCVCCRGRGVHALEVIYVIIKCRCITSYKVIF